MSEEEKKEENKVEPTDTEVKKEEKAEPTATEEKKDVEVPAKFKKLVEEIENLTVIELHELVKVLEEKFGVSAASVVSGGGGDAGDGDAEDDTVAVELTDSGASKVAVIKVIKDILGLGLKEAKDLVDGVPSIVKEDIEKKEADEIKQRIEEAGGKVNIK